MRLYISVVSWPIVGLCLLSRLSGFIFALVALEQFIVKLMTKNIIGNGDGHDLRPVIHYAFIYSHLALAFSVVKIFSDFIVAKGDCDHKKIS